MELSRDINKITVLTRAVSRSYPTASHCVVDVLGDVVLVGEVRVAPGPQAKFNRVVCRDYPRLTRKARDVNPNTKNRPHDFDAREVLYESHASYHKTGTPQPQQDVIKSKVIKLPPSRSVPSESDNCENDWLLFLSFFVRGFSESVSVGRAL